VDFPDEWIFPMKGRHGGVTIVKVILHRTTST
jgi:hypothetical protein